MKNSNLFFIFFVLILFISCEQSKQSDVVRDVKPIHVNVSEVADYYDIAPDVEEDCEIIALETFDDCLISYMDKIQYENNQYFILDKKASCIFIFDNEGRFVKKLDKKGQGPGEYMSIGAFEVIDNMIWITDIIVKNIICYDMNLNFVKKITPGITPFDICNIKDQIYIATNWTGYEEQNSQLESYNIYTDEKKSYLQVPSNNLNYILIGKSRQLAQYGDSALFFYSYCDTIFQLKENSVQPVYALNFSERYEDIPLTLEKLRDPTSTMIRGISDIIYTGKSVILKYGDQGLRVAVYNENNSTCQVYSSFGNSDLGNMRLWNFQLTKNREIICFYDAHYILESYSQIIDDTKFKQESDKQRIKNMIKGLKAEDNPVIFRFRLKADSSL